MNCKKVSIALFSVVIASGVSNVSFAQKGKGNEKEVFKMTFENTKDKETVTEIGACLLYTSPSPRDRTRSRMPSSA